MRITKFIVLLVVVSLSLSIALPAFAADARHLTDKTKCAGLPRPLRAKARLARREGTTVSVDQLTDLLTKGAEAKKARTKSISRSPDDAKPLPST